MDLLTSKSLRRKPIRAPNKMIPTHTRHSPAPKMSVIVGPTDFTPPEPRERRTHINAAIGRAIASSSLQMQCYQPSEHPPRQNSCRLVWKTTEWARGSRRGSIGNPTLETPPLESAGSKFAKQRDGYARHLRTSRLVDRNGLVRAITGLWDQEMPTLLHSQPL